MSIQANLRDHVVTRGATVVIRHLQFFQLLKRFQLSKIGYQILPEEELLQIDTCQRERAAVVSITGTGHKKSAHSVVSIYTEESMATQRGYWRAYTGPNL